MGGSSEIRPVAVVTGADRGIGLGIARSLARSGFDIAACCRDSSDTDELEQAAATSGAALRCFPLELVEIEKHGALIAHIADSYGRIDCLVSNAGIASPRRGDMLKLHPEDFDLVMNVNLRGTLFLSQAAALWMLEHPSSDHVPRSQIFITSVSASIASPERSDYCISKAALSTWARLLTLRLASAGIGVFEIRPGIIRTNMTEGLKDRYDSFIDGGLVPAKRWGTPDDVGEVAARLAGGSFAFATGSTIDLDGGLSIAQL